MNQPIAIVLGDVHWPVDDDLKIRGLQRLFEYIRIKYPTAKLILTGDVLDSATTVRWLLVRIIREEFLKWPAVHWVQGNHDVSDFAGSACDAFEFDNVFCYREPQFVEIDGLNFFMLPHLLNTMKMIREYPLIQAECDYAITHTAAPGTNYNVAEIDLPGVRPKFVIIDGHIHTAQELTFHEVLRLIIGIPQTKIEGEQGSIKRMVLIHKDRYEIEDLPVFFDIKDLMYGEDPPSPDFRYNIRNAPDKESVWERYKGYSIREKGIHILRTDDDIPESLEELKKEQQDSFNYQAAKWIEENELKQEVRQSIDRLMLEVPE